MAATQEQKAEMVAKIREYERTGHPELSAPYRAALAAGEYYQEAIDPESAEAAQPPRYGKGSGRDNWVRFAMEYSDFDEEVIMGASRDDLIAMLEVYGVIEGTE